MQINEETGPTGQQTQGPKKFNFSIVGGGTAGWLTALYIKKYYPWANVRVIASSEIGILGAGEGTTPQFISFLDSLGIAVSDIVKYAKGTIKNGIKFTNWNGDNESYFHNFADAYDNNAQKIGDISGNGHSSIILEQIALGESLDDVLFSSQLSQKNLVGYSPTNSLYNKNEPPILHFNKFVHHALHFDAKLLAKFLKKTAMYRGIKFVVDDITTTDTDENGYITGLHTKKGELIPSDFVFDCSGFSRLLVGDFFKTKWISYADSLPMKKSIAFFIPNDSDTIPPYTESIAMKYGWVWKIPVEGRYGCGYCFDSDFITDEEAIAELKEQFGEDIEVGNAFVYDAGRYENTWVKNCIAIGLAGGFVEPLEATSIWGVIAQLRYFTENTIGAMNRSEFIINKYNRKVAKFNDDTKDFIFLHYLTKREDSDFWKTFRDKNKTTENIQKLLDECTETMPDNDFLISINTHYESSSFYSIMSGLGLFDKYVANNTFNSLVSDIRRDEIAERKKLYFLNMFLTLKIAQEHADFIKYLR